MGVKNWFAKNVAGAGAYGGVMGRESAKNGLALGRILYLGHGSQPWVAYDSVFEDVDSMEAEGFMPYCTDPANWPPVEDASTLSTFTRAVGVAFAAKLTDQAGFQLFANLENKRKFSGLAGASCMAYLRENSPDITSDLLVKFFNVRLPEGTPLVDYEQPGTDDFLGALLKLVSDENLDQSIAFQRRGILGFDKFAVELSKQTLAMIQKAASDFGW